MVREVHVQRSVERVVESENEEERLAAGELFGVDERVVAVFLSNVVWIRPGDFGRDLLAWVSGFDVPVEILDPRAARPL